jgi:dihydrofolate reductase
VRSIINSTYVTLDGVIQNPQNWPVSGGFSEEGGRIQFELLERCDALLMGRHTYDGFAPAWSSRSGDPFSDRMNALPKYVLASTLTDLTDLTDTTVLDDGVVILTYRTGTP